MIKLTQDEEMFYIQCNQGAELNYADYELYKQIEFKLEQKIYLVVKKTNTNQCFPVEVSFNSIVQVLVNKLNSLLKDKFELFFNEQLLNSNQKITDYKISQYDRLLAKPAKSHQIQPDIIENNILFNSKLPRKTQETSQNQYKKIPKSTTNDNETKNTCNHSRYIYAKQGNTYFYLDQTTDYFEPTRKQIYENLQKSRKMKIDSNNVFFKAFCAVLNNFDAFPKSPQKAIQAFQELQNSCKIQRTDLFMQEVAAQLNRIEFPEQMNGGKASIFYKNQFKKKFENCQVERKAKWQ